jgi:signal transduction histidine kinase
MNASQYALFGLSALLGVLVALVMFAVLRFGAALREPRRRPSAEAQENALLSSALEDAIAKLKAQERATAARAEASERLSEQIVASLTSGLLVVDGSSRVQMLNPAAERILSLPPSAIGADYREVLRDAPALANLLGEALASREPVQRRTATVNQTHLGVSVSPLTANGSPGGAICLFTDLSKVVALEEQLQLKDSLARLGELTAGLAHEFRNGLATIHGYGRLLDPALVPPQYRPYVEGIRSETQALGEVVTNFLKFARPEPLTVAPVEIRSVIERAAEDVPSADVSVTGEFATVEGDEVLLRQAFSNLFRNSVDAAQAAGTSPRIHARGSLDRAARLLYIEVGDNGPGIPAHAAGHIFQPFFTTRSNGTGLGLAIVQKIVVSHNGLISASNGAEGGAVFRITMPLDGPQTARIT